MGDKQSEARERYLGIGVALGSAFSVAIGAGLGVALGNLAWGIGIALGAARGSKNAKAGQEPSGTRWQR